MKQISLLPDPRNAQAVQKIGMCAVFGQHGDTGISGFPALTLATGWTMCYYVTIYGRANKTAVVRPHE
jgi:hypothetical protein